MKKRITLTLMIALLLAVAMPAMAQEENISPQASTPCISVKWSTHGANKLKMEFHDKWNGKWPLR